MVPLPRLAAKAFTSSAAGVDRLDAPSRNTIVAEVPDAGAGIVAVAGTTGDGGGGGATDGRVGGALDNGGKVPASAAVAVGGAAGGDRVGAADEATVGE